MSRIRKITPPSSGINSYIKNLQRQRSRKNDGEGTRQNGKRSSSTKKGSSSAVFIEPCLWYKNIYK